MSALWHQTQSLHPAFKRFNDCLRDDWFLLPYELRLQAVHADVLARAHVLSTAEADAIKAALRAIKDDYMGAPCPPSDAEDIHTWLEAEITHRVGSAGKRIHTARSRNDQVATLIDMFLIDSANDLRTNLTQLVRATAEKAKALADVIMPMQTHAQFAAPGSAGFWLLRFADAFNRWRRRAQLLQQEWQHNCPLGAGAIAGSSIHIDRQQQANGLGFDSPAANALNATSSRDHCLEWFALLAHLGLTMQSFAADVLAFCQTPFGWVMYPAQFGTGSSMMPNKHNPDAMELLRGEACALSAAHHQATLLVKGLTSGYQRDLQTIKPLLRDATSTSRNLIALMTDFISALEFDRDQLAACFDDGNLMATLEMEALVASGIPLRDAHHQIAQRIADGETFNDVTPGSLARYRTIGSAAPAETTRVADDLLRGLVDSNPSPTD